MQSYVTLHGDVGYLTYDKQYDGIAGFFGIGCDYVVTGEGTYDINGGGWQIGTGGITYSEPATPFSPGGSSGDS